MVEVDNEEVKMKGYKALSFLLCWLRKFPLLVLLPPTCLFARVLSSFRFPLFLVINSNFDEDLFYIDDDEHSYDNSWSVIYFLEPG